MKPPIEFKKALEEWAGPNFNVTKKIDPKSSVPHKVRLSSVYIVNYLKKYNFNKIKNTAV